MTVPVWVAAVIGVAALVVGAVVAALIAFKQGIEHRRREAEAAIGSAEAEAERIRKEANDAASRRKKEMLLEAKDEIHRLRNEAERENKERRKDIQRQENRLQQKEEALDRKIENYEKKEEQIAKKQKEIDDRLSDVENLKKGQFEMLERISGFTVEQAKEYLLNSLTEELTHEKARAINEIEAQFKEEADARARALISQAIQRVAADQVTESTVSVVPLPNDEMKGRIIGREGRNIRTIETLTGVDLIIDDTPEAITLSCFDPVRREIARIAIERLISDGRIHPARIEEMVEKARREVEQTIKQEGERAVLETGLRGIHPEIMRLLGRLHYRTSYGQNVLNHAMEVSFLSGMMASELGIDPVVARRAGLLHDIGKAIDHEVEGSHVEIGANVAEAKRAGLLHDLGKSIDHEVEGSHVQIGVELARKYKENEAVVHAIQAHHGDVEAQTVVACLVQAADAISAARPGARRENLENYIKRLEKLE
ncbi:MAG: ribonuclease Y, partial [Clostridia bacterium]|nr:ribonuclease Y [Clostridia bacterium]